MVICDYIVDGRDLAVGSTSQSCMGRNTRDFSRVAGQGVESAPCLLLVVERRVRPLAVVELDPSRDVPWPGRRAHYLIAGVGIGILGIVPNRGHASSSALSASRARP